MAEHVALSIYCAYCHGAVTLQVADWPDTPDMGTLMADALPEANRWEWACPYCEAPNRWAAPGRLAWVAKRLPAGDRTKDGIH